MYFKIQSILSNRFSQTHPHLTVSFPIQFRDKIIVEVLQKGVLCLNIPLNHSIALSLSEIDLHNPIHQDVSFTDLLEARGLVDQIVSDGIVLGKVYIRVYGVWHRGLVDEVGTFVLPVQTFVDDLTLRVAADNFLRFFLEDEHCVSDWVLLD